MNAVVLARFWSCRAGGGIRHGPGPKQHCTGRAVTGNFRHHPRAQFKVSPHPFKCPPHVPWFTWWVRKRKHMYNYRALIAFERAIKQCATRDPLKSKPTTSRAVSGLASHNVSVMARAFSALTSETLRSDRPRDVLSPQVLRAKAASFGASAFCPARVRGSPERQTNFAKCCSLRRLLS